MNVNRIVEVSNVVPSPEASGTTAAGCRAHRARASPTPVMPAFVYVVSVGVVLLPVNWLSSVMAAV